jgi:hypothetical protein
MDLETLLALRDRHVVREQGTRRHFVVRQPARRGERETCVICRSGGLVQVLTVRNAETWELIGVEMFGDA